MKFMIGIGKWEASINTFMFKAKGTAEIKDNNGEYEILFDLPEKFNGAKIKYYDIREIGDDTLTGKGEISLFPGKVAEGTFTFNGDKMSGTVKLPIMGGMEIKIKDGHRVS
ncbi:MAG: hypothetical protein NC122_09795 [Faecalibacterium sp.]|nr:hypothetical protein [Ruminococcus sp.]MCM1392499.1 hypothetical protein [Ruminococcus sp.]MCM1486483.1 hypothetical protein [Faecalibacterium sp.]